VLPSLPLLTELLDLINVLVLCVALEPNEVDLLDQDYCPARSVMSQKSPVPACYPSPPPHGDLSGDTKNQIAGKHKYHLRSYQITPQI
jgi:hypothetical protein